MKHFALIAFLIFPSLVFAQFEPKTSLSGDLRLRDETVENEAAAGKDHYNQLKIRARLEFKAEIKENLAAEIRLATGPGGTSTNQTFSGSRNYDFRLDRGFFKYKPEENILVKAGRTDNPFVLVGGNNLLFDTDLNFDGASASYVNSQQDLKYQVILAHAVLTENSSSTAASARGDIKLNSIEFAIGAQGDVHSGLITLAEYVFQNTKDNSVVVSAAGNSVSGTNYLYNYDVTALGFEYGYASAVPFAVYAEYANNNRTSANDTAYLVGIRINKVKKKRDWMISFDTREVEKDSTLGSLTDGESFGGGTNGISFNTIFAYALEDSAQLAITYVDGGSQIAKGETTLNRNRVLLDLSIKF